MRAAGRRGRFSSRLEHVPGIGVDRLADAADAANDPELLRLVPPHGGWSLLLDVGELGFDSETASRRLFEHGRIAATPMVNWGRADADRYVRFVFANEPSERLEGIGARVREAVA